MTLEPGLEAVFRYTATQADTAAAVGGGEVPVRPPRGLRFRLCRAFSPSSQEGKASGVPTRW